MNAPHEVEWEHASESASDTISGDTYDYFDRKSFLYTIIYIEILLNIFTFYRMFLNRISSISNFMNNKEYVKKHITRNNCILINLQKF